MRVMLVCLVVSAMAGCGVEPAVAPPDADPPDVPTCHDDGDNTTFCAPIGEACSFSSNWFCDGGLGWCLDDRCRGFCGESTARCPLGQHQDHSSFDGRDLCVCVPD